ncbi:tripartite-type tricarboxylate transporter receptor subunit TctC [Paraburkholderia sp. GAS199]|uniref:tripartite tricarboxylate transporter substrate binding protein n=1 Tax=Paraburkholderia sp. GAS199 TaxID=3035126 RepID=UPI003D1C60A2
MNRFRLRRAMAIAALSLPFCPVTGHADSPYPNRPIRMIVPFVPGGASDNLARALAAELTKKLGQNAIVENKPGAGTVIGSQYVAHAEPDGYTLLWATAPLAINATLMKHLPYDTLKDLTAVVDVASSPEVLVVNKSRNITTLAQLIDTAKKNPGKLTYGSSGIGGSPHLATVVFANDAGIKLTHVPYQGSAPAVTAAMSGQVDMVIDTFLTCLPGIQAGTLIPLAQTEAKRASPLPNVPTMQESGMKGYQASAWFSLLAPSKVPKPIIDKLNQAVNEIIQQPKFQQLFAKQAIFMVGGTPEAAEAHLRNEVQRWQTAVKESGASID